jgi:hypothetical protein
MLRFAAAYLVTGSDSSLSRLTMSTLALSSKRTRLVELLGPSMLQHYYEASTCLLYSHMDRHQARQAGFPSLLQGHAQAHKKDADLLVVYCRRNYFLLGIHGHFDLLYLYMQQVWSPIELIMLPYSCAHRLVFLCTSITGPSPAHGTPQD